MELDRERVLWEWRAHLATSQPKKLGTAIIIIVAAATIVLLSTHNPLLALITVLLLISAEAEFIFPIHYRLTEKGIYSRNLISFRFLPWEKVRRCYRGPRGIKLSPLNKPDWREAFRGINLWVAGDAQEQAVVLIQSLRPMQKIVTEAEKVASCQQEIKE